MEPTVHFMPKDLEQTLLLINANESLRGKVRMTTRRAWLRFRLGLPGWIRPSVLGGKIYLIMPGVIVSYEYEALFNYSYTRRNGA